MGLGTVKISIERKLKIFLIKIFNKNVHIGNNTRIDINTRIYNKDQKIRIEDNVYLRSQKKGYQAGMPFPTTLLIDVRNAEIIIGENSRINGAYIHAQKKIKLGKNCVIASGVNIIDSNGHELLSGNRTIGRDKPEEIILGDNVWVGLNAIILKGTTIGANSVVAAGCVVKGTFPDNSLIAGNPATVVKTLDIPL